MGSPQPVNAVLFENGTDAMIVHVELATQHCYLHPGHKPPDVCWWKAAPGLPSTLPSHLQ